MKIILIEGRRVAIEMSITDFALQLCGAKDLLEEMASLCIQNYNSAKTAPEVRKKDYRVP